MAPRRTHHKHSPRGTRKRSASPRGSRKRSASPRGTRKRSASPRGTRKRSASPRGSRKRSASPRGSRKRSASPRGTRKRSASPRGSRKRSASPRGSRKRSPAARKRGGLRGGASKRSAHAQKQRSHRRKGIASKAFAQARKDIGSSKHCKDVYDRYYAQAVFVMGMIAIMIYSFSQQIGTSFDAAVNKVKSLWVGEGHEDSSTVAWLNEQMQRGFGYVSRLGSVGEDEDFTGPMTYTNEFGYIGGMVQYVADTLESNKQAMGDIAAEMSKTPIRMGLTASGALVADVAVGDKMFALIGKLWKLLLRMGKSMSRVLQPLADRFRSLNDAPLACAHH